MTNAIYTGNCIDVMNSMPKELVQCVVTSPPYWSMRVYDGAQDSVWGGDNPYEHEVV